MRVLSFSSSSSSSWFLSMCSVGVFFPGVDIIEPAESGSARSAGKLADVFFFLGPCVDSAFMHVTVYVLRTMVYSVVCVF